MRGILIPQDKPFVVRSAEYADRGTLAERGRIRTSDTAFDRIAPFAGRCFRPLSHLSINRKPLLNAWTVGRLRRRCFSPFREQGRQCIPKQLESALQESTFDHAVELESNLNAAFSVSGT